MVQIIEPEYWIHIGIKDGKAISVDWKELYQREYKDKNFPQEPIKEFVTKCLEEAIEIIRT